MKQIETKQKSFDRNVQDAQEEFGSQQQDIASKILQKMAPMIVKYSQENGFGIIVDTSKPWPQSNVLWWGEAVDITKPVVVVTAPLNTAGRIYELAGPRTIELAQIVVQRPLVVW